MLTYCFIADAEAHVKLFLEVDVEHFLNRGENQQIKRSSQRTKDKNIDSMAPLNK